MPDPGQRDLVLLPCARLVPGELRGEFGPLPSGLVPLGGRPALAHIVERYAAEGFAAAVAIHERGDLVRGWIARNPGVRVETVDVGPTRSLGETVLEALRAWPGTPGRVVVNFADTLVLDPVPDGDFVHYREQEDTYRYTTFASAPGNRIADVVDKESAEDVTQSAKVFVGVFGFADARLLVDCLAAAEPGAIDPFYTAVERYSRERPSGMPAVQAERWYDLGHLDTYYETKRSLFLGQRQFNDVRVDATRGVIRKSSRDHEKFADEISWYLRLPGTLAHIAPRVFDHSLDPAGPWVEMEFYGYPALNDAYLVGNWDGGVWARVLAALRGLVEELRRHELRAPGVDDALREMYVDKTRIRIESLLAARPDWLVPFLTPGLRINGRPVRTLAEVLDDLPSLVKASGAYDLDHVTVIHGDLCLSNLLYDTRNGIVRTVDPRGRFGPFDVHGDPRYDLAKLSHSLHGDYDLLLAGQFGMEVDGGDVRLVAHLDDGHRVVKDLFEAWITRHWSGELPVVRFVESLLFLSLVPLHADNPRSQAAFLARGLELLSESEQSWD